MKTFVIGDIHGHWNRLMELIEKSGAARDGAEIVLLGDVGHYGVDTHRDDLLTWQYVMHLPNRVVLWGNHDYANVKPSFHSFRGHDMAYDEVMEYIKLADPQFIIERHGYLLSHAGLAPRFAPPPGMPIEMTATTINKCEGYPVIDDISYRRGGYATQGGILWRDADEPLADFPQVFGHTRGSIRRYGPNQQSWCIDVASKDNDELAGLWLPDRKIVAVGTDAAIHETPWEDSE